MASDVFFRFVFDQIGQKQRKSKKNCEIVWLFRLKRSKRRAKVQNVKPEMEVETKRKIANRLVSIEKGKLKRLEGEKVGFFG
jgi:hypothetical protein